MKTDGLSSTHGRGNLDHLHEAVRLEARAAYQGAVDVGHPHEAGDVLRLGAAAILVLSVALPDICQQNRSLQ